MMCIATEESFFVLKYSAEAVEKARENPESITEDGIEDAFDVSYFWTMLCMIRLYAFKFAAF